MFIVNRVQNCDKMKIGIIREEKIPPDSRVPLTPHQCVEMKSKYADQIEIFVQPSPNRCYRDSEYLNQGVRMKEDLSDCDVLMGVKEVPIDKLISDKTYFFFSHTIKEQPYNQKLLKAIVNKNIQLIDYEKIDYNNGFRVIGFGRFAGIVGAHNGLQAYGQRTNAFTLPAAHAVKDYEELLKAYDDIQFPKMKIILTGQGRVAKGAREQLLAAGIKEVTKVAYLNKTFDEAIFATLHNEDLYINPETKAYVESEFYAEPKKYVSIFEPYISESDLMINGIYWDNDAPIYFTKERMKQDDFRIKTIADITCDIEGSIPATLKASVIGDPVFGYDAQSENECAPYTDTSIDIMSVDNLPNELPRDASALFADTLVDQVIPELLQSDSRMIKDASITKNGDLTEKYEYLRDYLNGSV